MTTSGDYVRGEAFKIAVAAVCPHTDCTHEDTYHCSGWADAQDVLDALDGAGWRLVPPDGFPGLCPRCKTVVAEGTRHEPFNGNQMFACAVRDNDGDGE